MYFTFWINQTQSTVIGVLFNVHSKQSQKNLYPYVVRQQNAHAYTYIHTVNRHTKQYRDVKALAYMKAIADRIHTHEHIYILITIDSYIIIVVWIIIRVRLIRHVACEFKLSLIIFGVLVYTIYILFCLFIY